MLSRNPLLDGQFGTLMGLRLEVVPAGTTVRDERTGQEEAVGDAGAVKAGNVMYCTKVVYDRLVQEFGKAKSLKRVALPAPVVPFAFAVPGHGQPFADGD